MEEFYKIYDEKSKEINQGDLFELDSKEIKEYLEIESDISRKFIVLSNSCDLYQNNEVQNICIARIMTLKELIKKNRLNPKKIKKLAKNCCKYNDKVHFFLPNKNPILESSITKLDINNSYLFEELKEIILKKRIAGLISPYREKLGWAVGNLFNRVALENDENAFEKEIIDYCTKLKKLNN